MTNPLDIAKLSGCARPNRRARIETRSTASDTRNAVRVAPGLTAGRGLKRKVADIQRRRRRPLRPA